MRHTIRGETDQDLDDIHEIAKILRDVNNDNDNDDQTARFLKIAFLLGSLKRRAETRQRRMAPKRENGQ
jgi:hypothetical protein